MGKLVCLTSSGHGLIFKSEKTLRKVLLGMKDWDGRPSEHVPLPEGILNWDMG